MKKILYFLFFLTILAFSCSKDGMLSSDKGLDQLSGNNATKSCRAVIKVNPGSDDTKALIDAFALAKTYGKNTVVKLMPGTFKIGMIEVKEFNGTLNGSGKGKTIITNLSGLTPDAVIAQNKLPALIAFIGGDVSVSDLSIILSEELPWIDQYEMNMLLFSDYSSDDPMPAKKHIGVNLNNIEVTSIQQYYYPWFNGVKFAPDMLGPMPIPRSNIDATVTNSKFSKFTTGLLVSGCKSGNFKFGEGGGNIFTENVGGLWVQENVGVNVKIMKNEFSVPTYAFDGIDLNAYERSIFEYVPSKVGTFEIRDNIFNINNSESSGGFGIYDNWRYDHPENPDWMKMIWDHNTFNTLADGVKVGWIFGLKGAIFSNNKIVGNATGGHFGIYGSWLGPDDPNYLLVWTENCKFLNNLFLEKNFIIELDQHTKNCLIMGDLRNVTVNDAGVNNKVIRIKNPGH
jgi:hypothetical protein